MKACILAAGRGTRLAATGHTLPKGFLRLGQIPIIEESLSRLRAVGVSEIVLVTGYQAECYQAVNGVRCLHNPIFAESGSLHSLACAAPALAGHDFLLLESDLVYERRALEVCLASPQPDVVLLSGPTAASDEVWVQCDERDRLVAMSKDRGRLGSVAGELVGISKISAGLYDLLLQQAAQSSHQDYETDGLVRCAAWRPIHCLKIEDLLWAEIDDESHLERARGRVYPLLAGL